MYKFRSMIMQDEEKEKAEWSTRNDPRITPVGKLIRRTSIDELPQLFNVLKGEMSLVGPRPERPQFVQKFRDEIPRYMVKHQVRPGQFLKDFLTEDEDRCDHTGLQTDRKTA